MPEFQHPIRTLKRPEAMLYSHFRHVFVYGTLRRGEERDINRLQPAPRWVGHASVAGVLHHLGRYPGLVLGGPELVHGEVYEITAGLERVLDEIEEVWPQQTGEYTKREVMVLMEGASGSQALADGAPLACVLYEISPAHTRGKPVIPGGDWVLHRSACRS